MPACCTAAATSPCPLMRHVRVQVKNNFVSAWRRPRTWRQAARQRIMLQAQHTQRQRRVARRDRPGQLVALQQQRLEARRQRRQRAREAVAAEVQVAQRRRALERRQRAHQAAAALGLRGARPRRLSARALAPPSAPPRMQPFAMADCCCQRDRASLASERAPGAGRRALMPRQCTHQAAASLPAFCGPCTLDDHEAAHGHAC